MAQGKSQSTRTRAKAKPEVPKRGSRAKPPDAQRPVNGILIHRLEDKEGNAQTVVERVGDVKILEVSDILVLALRGWKDQHKLTVE